MARVIPLFLSNLGDDCFVAAPEESDSGQAKQFVELRDAGHNDVTLVATAELRAAIQAFLSRLD